MEQEILNKLAIQEQKIDQMYRSVERLRKYFLWTLVITVLTVVLPIIGLAILLPIIMGQLISAYNLPL